MTAGSLLLAPTGGRAQSRKEVFIGGNVPSTAEYDEFWGTVEELDVPVFMHPTNSANIVQPGVLGGPGGLNNVIGNPLETTLFLSRMIIDGTLDHFPNLKVCAGQVVYGTDIPAAWPDTLDLIVESPSLSDAEKEAIVGGNLIEMLKL